MTHSTIDPNEIHKFAAHKEDWWDINGPLKTLHDINSARLMFILKHTALQDKRVLDVGCGGGILSEGLAQNGAFVTAIDAEPNAIETAKKHADLLHLSIDYHCSSLEVYENTPFDLITCMELLEHVNDYSQVIAHAARLIKKDGLLFLSTINRTLSAYLTAIVGAEYLLSILPRQTHDYHKFIRPSELARVLRHYGFEVIQLKGMQYNPFTRKASLSDSTAVNYLLVAKRI